MKNISNHSLKVHLVLVISIEALGEKYMDIHVIVIFLNVNSSSALLGWNSLLFSVHWDQRTKKIAEYMCMLDFKFLQVPSL